MKEGMPFDDDALLPSGSSCDEDFSGGPSSDEEDDFIPQKKYNYTRSESDLEEVVTKIQTQEKEKQNKLNEEEIKQSKPNTDIDINNTEEKTVVKKALPVPVGKKLKATKRKAEIQNPTKEKVRKKTWRKECKICGKMISGSHYPAHVKSVHGNERPFKCDICGYGFTCKSHLIRHGYTHRPTAKKLTKKITYCRFCQWGFFRKDLLTQHETIHKNSEAFPCSYPDCQLSFFSKERLDDHCPVHNDPAPFKCPKCSKGFKTRIYLGDHMRRAHKISLEEHLDSISTYDTVLTATLNGSYVVLTQDKSAPFEVEAGTKVGSSAVLDLDLKTVTLSSDVPNSTEEGKNMPTNASTQSNTESLTGTDFKRENESSASEFKVEVKLEYDSSNNDGKTSLTSEMGDGMESEPTIENEDLKLRRSARNKKTTRKSFRDPKMSSLSLRKPIPPSSSSEDEDSKASMSIHKNSSNESFANDSSDGDEDEYIASKKRKRRKIEKCDSDGPIKPKKRKRKKVENKKPPPRKDCDICGKSIITWHLAEHISAVHDKIKRKPKPTRVKKECDICGKLITRMSEHKSNVHGGVKRKRDQVECKICGKFVLRLSEHVKFVHENYRPLKCHICGDTFVIPARLKTHLLSHTDPIINTSKKILTCRFCKWGFYRGDLLQDHLKLHDEREKFSCTFKDCDYSFFSKEMLTDHCRVIHEDPTPFKCPKCSKQCPLKKNLYHHMRTSHRIQLDAYLETISTYETVLSATCTILKESLSNPTENQELQSQDSPNPINSTTSTSES